jgi:hypothetical protein
MESSLELVKCLRMGQSVSPRKKCPFVSEASKSETKRGLSVLENPRFSLSDTMRADA